MAEMVSGFDLFGLGEFYVIEGFWSVSGLFRSFSRVLLQSVATDLVLEIFYSSSISFGVLWRGVKKMISKSGVFNQE